MSSAGQTDLSDGLPALTHDESHLVAGDADHLGHVKVGARIIVTTRDCVVVGRHPASLEPGQLALFGSEDLFHPVPSSLDSLACPTRPDGLQSPDSATQTLVMFA